MQKLPALKKGEYYVTPIKGNEYNGYQLTSNSYGIIIAGIYKGATSDICYNNESFYSYAAGRSYAKVPHKRGEFTDLQENTFLVEHTKGKSQWSAVKPTSRPNCFERAICARKDTLEKDPKLDIIDVSYKVERDKDVAIKAAERNELEARYRRLIERREFEARDRRWIHTDSSLYDSRDDYSSQSYVVGTILSRSSLRMLNDRSSIQNDSADDDASLFNSISKDNDNAKHNELPKSKDSKFMSTLNSSVKKSHPPKKLEPIQR